MYYEKNMHKVSGSLNWLKVAVSFVSSRWQWNWLCLQSYFVDRLSGWLTMTDLHQYKGECFTYECWSSVRQSDAANSPWFTRSSHMYSRVQNQT